MIGCFCCFKEGSMRTYWLTPIMLLAAMLPAAANSVIIPLHHLSAAEVERRLLPHEARAQLQEAQAVLEQRVLVPEGVTAWTVDERRNALEVTGFDEGIQSLRHIIQLLDVPPPQVRLSVRVLPLVDGGLTGLTAEPMPPGVPRGQATEFAATASRDQLAVLERQAAFTSFEMTVSGNHALHLLWNKGLDSTAVPATVTPRVNSDGTVTLYVSRRGLSLPGQEGVFVIRRLPSGQGAVLISRSLGSALVVEVREALPEPAAGK
jgi:hypothetical protein